MVENQMNNTTNDNGGDNDVNHSHSTEIKTFEGTPGLRAPFDSSSVHFNYNHSQYHHHHHQHQQQEHPSLLDNPEITRRRRPSLPPPTVPLIIHLGNPSNTAAIMSGTNKNTLRENDVLVPVIFQ